MTFRSFPCFIRCLSPFQRIIILALWKRWSNSSRADRLSHLCVPSPSYLTVCSLLHLWENIHQVHNNWKNIALFRWHQSCMTCLAYLVSNPVLIVYLISNAILVSLLYKRMHVVKTLQEPLQRLILPGDAGSHCCEEHVL